MGRLTPCVPSLILIFMSELERIVTKRPKISIPDEWDVTIKRLSNQTRISEAELYRMAIKLLFESYILRLNQRS
jgi:hypothetical protein